MESIETLNLRLIEHFGVSWDNSPIWRIVYSETQFEKRLTEYTDAGVALLFAEYRELPKYRQWIKEKWILERFTIVPEINKKELTEKLSYEPIFVFEDNKGNSLPPNWDAAKFVIDTIYAACGNESMGPKYIDPEIDNPQGVRNARVTQLQEDLFGNETRVGDSLAHHEGVSVPHNYIKES